MRKITVIQTPDPGDLLRHCDVGTYRNDNGLMRTLEHLEVEFKTPFLNLWYRDNMGQGFSYVQDDPTRAPVPWAFPQPQTDESIVQNITTY